MALPESLQGKLALWRGKARVFREQGELFTPDSWIAVLLGQNVQPTSFDPLTGGLPLGEATRFMAHIREMIGKTAEAMPTHEDFIAQHCAAPMFRQA
ncbi:tryptophan 7-halogenase [Sphingomonas sp. LR59]